MTDPVPSDRVGTDALSTIPQYVLCGPHPSQRRTPVACTSVAHGHTAAEQTVYEFLWKAAGIWGRSESGEARLLRFKQQWLAGVLGLHENSVRSILKHLIRKLAMEESAKAGPAQGREVRIYSPDAILARRSKAGLVWAVRSHGVTLLTTEDLQQMTDPGISIGTDIVGTDIVGTDAVDTDPKGSRLDTF